MNIYIWAASHEISIEQVNDLISRDHNVGAKILQLKDIDVDLHNVLCNIPIDANYTPMVRALIKILDDIQTKHKDCNIHLVQPAGNPKLQYILGIHMYLEPYTVLYSYSTRVSKDIPIEGGGTKTISIFKHIKFQ